MIIDLLIPRNKNVLDKLQHRLFTLGYKWFGGETSPINISHGLLLYDKYIIIIIDYETKYMTYSSFAMSNISYCDDITNLEHVKIRSTNVKLMYSFLKYGCKQPVYTPRKINMIL